MNYPILVGDLQKLTKVSAVEEVEAGEGAPLVKFKTEYPVLFDCLYSTFGTFLSNSRLCEQVHGMSRHNLRTQVGMEQADHQRIYCTTIDYEMKEGRRNINCDAEDFKGKKRKAAKHSRTKAQLHLLSKQMCDRACAFVADVEGSDLGESLPSISSIKKKGRRAMDQENLDKQMMREEERAGQLRRKHLTPVDVATMAAETKLSNDTKYVSDEALIRWHERVPQLLVQSWWDVPAKEMNARFRLAGDVFVHWPHDHIDPDTIKTKTAKLKMIKDHVRWCNERLKIMNDQVQKIGSFHPSVHESDIKSFFV